MGTRYAVVTGASKGIGLAISKELLKKGYTVFGLSRSTRNEQGIIWIPCDVSNEASVKEAFSLVFQRTCQIDLLVCNAGIGISGAVEFAEESEYYRQIDVNFFGAVRCVQQVIPYMRAKKCGKIIFISSLAAIFPLPFQSFYSVSKSGLNAFADALGIELRPFQIQTCSVMLNDVKSEFTKGRSKNITGDDIYAGRIQKSVGKMERSEQNGMGPEKVALEIGRLADIRRMPPHKIVGVGNVFLGILYRILPARVLLWLLGKLYG